MMSDNTGLSLNQIEDLGKLLLCTAERAVSTPTREGISDIQECLLNIFDAADKMLLALSDTQKLYDTVSEALEPAAKVMEASSVRNISAFAAESREMAVSYQP